MRTRAVLGRTSIALAAATAFLTGIPASATPTAGSFAEAFAYSIAHPGVTPPGSNDYTCVPSAQHPEPVVLVHGFLENSYDNWASLSPKLTEAGYCVFAIDYGNTGPVPALGALESIPESAAELSTFVDSVLAATGAEKVSIVGHSKGGTVPRYYTRFLGGDRTVARIVALSPPNYPTAGPPVQDDVLQRLNEGNDTVSGIEYTTIVTRYDQIVVPYTASLLTGAGNTNVVLQDVCPANVVEHTGISYDPLAQRLVQNALDPENALPISC
ncbi:esterase/lipase family protein [Rhodococcoides yunnanense]|uniref:Alpha/beta fold hydrolase n=1 Tax=Rhodococcoides yunnanense TaxID=278209 RepID=A0ABU4BKC1_9NOCA|nr:alpha/beta fold hydrolase [Rhodococcus yunnanensis]MDV6264673.1 alpha/beta fold hydrolase [Rhodococcus yunnanensis]